MCFAGFYRVLLGFTGCGSINWVLLGFTGFYWVLLGFTEFYWVPLFCYLVSQSSTRFQYVLLGLTGFDCINWVLTAFTEFYWVFRGIYFAFVDVAGFNGRQRPGGVSFFVFLFFFCFFFQLATRGRRTLPFFFLLRFFLYFL